jgi:hypothetical protein
LRENREARVRAGDDDSVNERSSGDPIVAWAGRSDDEPGAENTATGIERVPRGTRARERARPRCFDPDPDAQTAVGAVHEALLDVEDRPRRDSVQAVAQIELDARLLRRLCVSRRTSDSKQADAEEAHEDDA